MSKLARIKLRETAIEQSAVMDISAPLDRAYAEGKLDPDPNRNLIRYKAGRVFQRDWIEASGGRVAGMKLIYVDGGGDREEADARRARAVMRRAKLGSVPGMTPLRLSWVVSFCIADLTPHALAKGAGCDIRTVWGHLRAALDALAEEYGARLDTVHTWRVEKIL